MRYVRLVAVVDEYDCEPGLVVKGTRMTEGMAADRDGMMIAHDILEHQNGIAKIGPVDDELEALGGVWQVRGRHGDLCSHRPNYHSIATNIASDITRMAAELSGCDWWPRLGRYRTHQHDYDEDFLEALEIARRDIRQELRDNEDQDFPLEAYLDNALHLMRRGFRKAERRFGSGFEGYTLFRRIRDAVATSRPDYEGQEFLLGYGKGWATVREIYEEDYT